MGTENWPVRPSRYVISKTRNHTKPFQLHTLQSLWCVPSKNMRRLTFTENLTWGVWLNSNCSLSWAFSAITNSNFSRQSDSFILPTKQIQSWLQTFLQKMDSLEFNFKETDHYLPMQENRQQQHLALELLSVFFEVQLRNTSHILPYNITYLTHDPRTCPDESTLSPSVRTSLIKNPTLTFQSHCLILVSLLFLYA